jgi:hypothetical protein
MLSRTSSRPFWIIVLCLFTLIAPATFAQSFVVRSAAGPDADSIRPVVDAFRAALGANNGTAAGQQPGGRREISWDGGGAAANATQFPTPMTTFANRGAVFTTPGTGFEISGQPTPEFGDLDPSYPDIFTTFSSPRLFTPLGSNVTDVHFFIAGADTPARVNAFGAVFTDVDLPDGTSLEYFDADGESLGLVYLPPANNGLSFVGVQFEAAVVARVRITSGNTAPASGAIDGGLTDVVAMDDFIYGEPSVVGPPTSAQECMNGGWRSFDFPRAFANQGDCIQFVKTGR